MLACENAACPMVNVHRDINAARNLAFLLFSELNQRELDSRWRPSPFHLRLPERVTSTPSTLQGVTIAQAKSVL